MAKRHKKKEVGGGGKPLQQAEFPRERLPAKTKKIVFFGVALLALGFYILTWTDPSGRNWASHLSPFLILGAYGLIAAGLMLPGEPPATPPPPSFSRQP